MRIPVVFPLCTVCFEREPDTFEHLVPDSVGGQFETKMLCASCNSTFGHDLDHEFKTDPQIRLAVENIIDEAPEFYHKFTDGLEYVGKGSQGKLIRMQRRNGAFRVREYQAEDRSIISDIPRTRRAIAKELQKRGQSESLADVVQQFTDAEYDSLVPISDYVSVVKGKVSDIQPRLSGRFVSNQLKLRMGWTHVAFLISQDIHDYVTEFRSYFNPILKSLGSNGVVPDYVEIDTRMLASYDPKAYHIVRYVGEEEALSIHIQMFNVIRYSIRFIGFTPGVADLPMLIHDVANKKAFMAKSYEDFKKGILLER